jgi:hypothetical protein
MIQDRPESPGPVASTGEAMTVQVLLDTVIDVHYGFAGGRDARLDKPEDVIPWDASEQPLR